MQPRRAYRAGPSQVQPANRAVVPPRDEKGTRGAMDKPLIVQTIQLALTPVFMLVAIGNIMNILSTRLGRIVDRSRVLQERHPETSGPDHDELVRENRLVDRRIHVIGRGACCLIAPATIGSMNDSAGGRVMLKTILPSSISTWPVSSWPIARTCIAIVSSFGQVVSTWARPPGNWSAILWLFARSRARVVALSRLWGISTRIKGSPGRALRRRRTCNRGSGCGRRDRRARRRRVGG